MNILLLRPRPDRETIGLQSLMICEPIELMLLDAVLKKNGHKVSIVDMILDRRPLERILRAQRPELVGITGYISHIGVIRRLAARIHKELPKVRVAVGGVHAAVCPDDFCDPAIDVVCRSAEDFYRLAGCADTRPEFPSRDLPIHQGRSYHYLFQRDCALLKTAEGCPYRCNFCFCKEIAPYRPRPTEEVLEELGMIRQTEVYIVDDNFLFDQRRLDAIIDGLKKRGINHRYLVYGRADYIASHPDQMKRLQEVGLRAVIVGVEAASQKELDAYDKRAKVSDNVEAIRILRKLRIECYATIILGLDWTKDDFDRLVDFVRGQKLVFVNLQPFTPMPGTPYFERYRERLIIPYERSECWDMAHLVVRPGALSVRDYYWQLLRAYLLITLRPGSLWYMIRRYGLWMPLRLSWGAQRITWQYVLKILRG